MVEDHAGRAVARSRWRRLVRAIGYGIVVAVVLLVLAVLVRTKWGPLRDLDVAVVDAATSAVRGHPAVLQFFVDWQWVFQPWRVYAVASLVCLLVWWRAGLRTRAWWAFITMMVLWNLALDAKLLVQRARPALDQPLESAPGYSFPSGHAANTAAACTALVLLLWPLLRRGWQRALAVGIAAVLIVVTALDRVFLGVHYPSDVTAGVVLGCGFVLASYAGFLGWSPPRPTTTSDDPPPTEE